MKISLLILAISLALAPHGIDKSTNKKMKKEISKVYKTEDFTLESLKTDKLKDINGDLFIIHYQKTIAYCYLGKVYTSRSQADNKDSEFFQYLILYNKNKEIEKVKILKYEAAYGREISSRSWLRQFKGYSGKEKLRLGKEIDAMSGATLSSEGITKDIKQISELLNAI